jgi:hypothetical protein
MQRNAVDQLLVGRCEYLCRVLRSTHYGARSREVEFLTTFEQDIAADF